MAPVGMIGNYRYIDVNEKGTYIKLNDPYLIPWAAAAAPKSYVLGRFTKRGQKDTWHSLNIHTSTERGL